MDCENEWRVLPLNSAIPEAYQITATPFGGNLLVFGGSTRHKVMFTLNEEGDFIEDLSAVQGIPLFMFSEPFIAQEGKIFAVGQTANDEDTPRAVLRVFNHKKNWYPMSSQ